VVGEKQIADEGGAGRDKEIEVPEKDCRRVGCRGTLVPEQG
jgi:hypothetical protein